MNSPDQEVVSRAKKILEALAEPLGERWATKVKLLANDGAADHLVEQLVYNCPANRKQAGWEALGQLAKQVIDWKKVDYPKMRDTAHVLQYCLKDPALFFKKAGQNDSHFKECSLAIRPGEPSGLVFVRAESIIVKKSVSGGVLVSAGEITGIPAGQVNVMSDSLVFANDSVAAYGNGSLFVCDGEFQAQGPYFRDSVIIARAGVCLNCDISKCIILSGGPVRMTGDKRQILDNVVVSAGPVHLPKDAFNRGTVIKQNQPPSFGPIQFFEPMQLGIEVESSQSGIQIRKIDPTKVFAKAGLQASDVLVTLDKKIVKSVEGFRKQLRHSLAVQKQMTFEVRRGEKTITISVQNKS